MAINFPLKSLPVRLAFAIVALMTLALVMASFLEPYMSIVKRRVQEQQAGPSSNDFARALKVDDESGQSIMEMVGNALAEHKAAKKATKKGSVQVSCSFNSPTAIPKYMGPVDKRARIHHTDPKYYKGPIVEGWGPNVSRDVTIWARPNENTVLLAPRNLGNDPLWCYNTKMLIFQHSRPSGFANRLDNRRTWMNYMRENRELKAFFVVGRPSGEKSEKIQQRIEEEHKLYGDILQVDYIEHPNNNTLKTIHALKYILSVNWNSRFPEFVMKTDDDVYINLPMLSDLIFKKNADYKDRKKIPMMGFLFVTSDVLQVEKERMNETYTDYLICPSYMYKETNYPTFTSGTGYIMPWWAVPCLYQESLNLPYFFIEDVYFGGFVADRCYVPKEYINGYSPLGKESTEAGFDIDLLIHYVNHDQKHNIHKFITSGHNKALEISR